MAKFQTVRGMQDLYGAFGRAHAEVIRAFRDVSLLYGFEEMTTPVVENTEVFARGMGETTDVVTKEMYTFEKSGESLSLRPEGTAGIIRAVISESLEQSMPLKLFYAGPMFRYERPQKGRYRQFWQAGVELLGADSPLADAEMIALGADILKELGLLSHIRLELNSLGDIESRDAHRTRLVEYFSKYEKELSEDSQKRLHKNPLRILDSKDEGDKKIAASAPGMETSLTPASAAFFGKVQEALTKLGVAFAVNRNLVRGLDYYRHTVFEFITEDLGAQGTVLGGGRYDGLGKLMGASTDFSGVGFGSGVERLALLLKNIPTPPRPVAVVPTGEDMQVEAFSILARLRRAGIASDMGYSGNLAKRMKRANKANAKIALILGPDELAKGCVARRDLDSGEQTEIPLKDIEHALKAAAR